jgi:phosphomannomutase
VADQAAKVTAVRDRFADRTVATDTLDGLTIELSDGSWLNVRASNTEPLLRLNVEAPTTATLAAVRDEALAVIRT